ncbi:hypothetical protein [Hoeflea sp.]|uniref:hypothetical protein n=1 Tax=Hoeflea sp. TaxID=1940281 RepID=UPI003B01203B
MERNGKVGLSAGTSKFLGGTKRRKHAGRGTSVLPADYDCFAVDPAAFSIRGGVDSTLSMASIQGDSNQLDVAVSRDCRSFGHFDIKTQDAGSIEPIERLSGSTPVAWGRTIDVIELSARFGIRSTPQTACNERSAAIANPRCSCNAQARGSGTTNGGNQYAGRHHALRYMSNPRCGLHGSLRAMPGDTRLRQALPESG